MEQASSVEQIALMSESFLLKKINNFLEFFVLLFCHVSIITGTCT